MAEDKFRELIHQKKRNKANPVQIFRSIRLSVRDSDREAVDWRQTTEGKEPEDALLQDPLEVLGPEIMMKMLSFLDARSLALSLVVSRGWHGVACSDRLWVKKCEELWLGKAHIPRSSQMPGLSKLAAYSISIMDGKRTRIMREDLCDHAWKFHFTEETLQVHLSVNLVTWRIKVFSTTGDSSLTMKVAPEYWRNLDPYWNGTGTYLRRYFHPDGSITADPDDEVWGGHECCFSIITSSVGDGEMRNHYVRVNRWPRLTVSRKQDWSWELSNNMCCYNSIPNAEKKDGTGPLINFP